MIAIESLEFAYPAGEFRLSIPRFQVQQGEKVAVIGPSGSGKTTLLNLIAGINVADSGQVEVAGSPVSRMDDAARRRFRITRVGFVFQDFELLDYLNVQDNILHPYRITRALRLTDEVRARAAELAAQMEIGDKLKRRIAHLSQGERQRVAICRALLPQPSLLLADEATGNLDPRNKTRILDLLFDSVDKQNATLLAVTHDHELLPRFNRVVDFQTFPGRFGVIDSVYIAWRYILFYKARSAILVACITLIAVLPLALNILLAESERQLLDRASSTPLVAGAKGSALDLVMNSLYFSDEVPELISMAATEALADMDLAVPIPLYVRFKARGFPIVGTTLDYFDFRGLSVQHGRVLGRLGECVIGAAVAEALDINAGDRLLSSPETVFDLAGVYPLNMQVAGVLARNYSADDLAVFVDLKTAWVIEGLVHGHQDLHRTTDSSVIMERSDNTVVANAKLVQYTEITDANLDSFHFHGIAEDYPLTAVIADPYDDKSSAILQGRYLDGQAGLQIVRPDEVVDALLQNIFRIKNVLDTVILLVGAATGLALVLVFALSLRLRQRELATIFRLGCSRLTTVRLLGAEIVIIIGVSTLLCLALLVPVHQFSSSLVRMLLIH